MSEFTCSQGHIMLPSKSMGGRCHICAAPCVRMDGMTDREMRARDKEFDREREEKKEDDNWWEKELPDGCGQCDQPLSEHDDGECPKKYRED